MAAIVVTHSGRRDPRNQRKLLREPAHRALAYLLLGFALAVGGCAPQPERAEAQLPGEVADAAPGEAVQANAADAAAAAAVAAAEETSAADAAPAEAVQSEAADAGAASPPSEAPPAASLPQAVGYRVQPGDQLIVDAARRNELDRTVRVDSEGNITLPYAGAVHVAGMTIAEIAPLLTQQLAPYYVEPQLNVSLEASVRQSVYVLGEVKRPGKFDLEGPTQVVDVIGRAAGPTYEAELRNVFIFRSQASPPLAIKANLQPWFRRGAEPDWNANVTVMAGDVVFLPSTVIYDVERFMIRMRNIVLPFVQLNDEFVVVDAD